MAFGKAFAAARKAGKKEFTYNGKRYNTKLAKDTPKDAPTPTARPSAEKTSKPSPSAKKAPRKSEKPDVVSEARKESSRSGAARSTAGKVKPKEKNSLRSGSVLGGFIKWGDAAKKSLEAKKKK